jgi:GT2 family glycosyltransferase
VTGSALDMSVVVPTFNRREIVLRSLETLFSQDFPSSRFEIIVVVDGSTDGSAAALRALTPASSFRVIEQGNRGLAGARNTGFREAKSNLVLFLDDDMQCDPGLVSAHFSAHQRLGPVAAFGALFLSADSRQNLASECFKREIGAFHLRHLIDPAAQWKVTDCVFSNSSIPREMLLKVDGFDEQFKMREDLELGIRLRENGVRMEYVKDAIAYQHYNKIASDLLADAEAFGAADALLARKHPEQMIEGHLRWLENDPSWKKGMRALMAKSPALERCLLAPWCALGDALFGFTPLRSVGLRALQMQRRIHWLRAVQRFSGS